MTDVWTITPPNIRSMIVPEPGFVLLEGDLARADAQVCAWDAGAEDLKIAFQLNHDIHTENAHWLYGDNIDPRVTHINGKTYRDNAKAAVHAVDYAVGYRTLAQSLSVQENRAADFIRHWTRRLHPAIGEWHDRHGSAIRGRRLPIARNAFGFRRVYTDRPDHLLSQYLAWICQSTVSIVINTGMKRIDCGEDIFGRPRCGTCVACRFAGHVHLLLQIHDSVLCLVRRELLDTVAPAVATALAVTVPYPDPLVIPVELKYSETDWGHMVKLPLSQKDQAA